jgi:hypothetical protein
VLRPSHCLSVTIGEQEGKRQWQSQACFCKMDRCPDLVPRLQSVSISYKAHTFMLFLFLIVELSKSPPVPSPKHFTDLIVSSVETLLPAHWW